VHPGCILGRLRFRSTAIRVFKFVRHELRRSVRTRRRLERIQERAMVDTPYVP
jgi:hypothetical protein